MRASRRVTIFLAVAAVGSAVTVALPASAQPVQARAARSWHVSFTVATPASAVFTAVTATGPSHAWAFEAANGKPPGAYQLSGSAWKKRAFPGTSNEQVISAGSSSASNVWAFTNTSEAVRFDGHSWSVVKKFHGYVSSGLVISATNVWVFGSAGTWHYNGSGWTRSNSGHVLYGGTALSPSSIWAYGLKGVAHWNGRGWTWTSLARLLPKITLGSPSLRGAYAASARSVYVLGSEGAESVGGPLVLLHYNGTSWRRLVVSKKAGNPTAIIPDGNGGLWIPVLVFILGGGVEHYSHGTLSSARLPISGSQLRLVGGATAPRSTAAFIVGDTRKSTSSASQKAVILRYGP